MHIFDKSDIKVDNAFIKKFAEKYVEQRTACFTPARTISTNFLLNSTGFNTSDLKRIITRNVIAEDRLREVGQTPTILNDIYSNKAEFEPHSIYFGLLSFTTKTIAETIELFTKKFTKIAV